MTLEEIAVKLEDHEHEIGSLKHRMKAAEEANLTIADARKQKEKIIAEAQEVAQREKQKAIPGLPSDFWPYAAAVPRQTDGKHHSHSADAVLYCLCSGLQQLSHGSWIVRQLRLFLYGG